MKKILYFIIINVFVIFISNNIIAEEINNDIKQKIQNDLTLFNEAINNQDYKSMINFMYPKIFKDISQQDLIDLLEKQKQDYIFQIIDSKINNFSDIFNFKNIYYCKIENTQKIKLIILSEVLIENKFQLVGKLVQEYGIENVEYDKESNEIYYISNSPIICISEDKTKWYYLDYKNSLIKVIPEEVLIYFQKNTPSN